MLARPTAALYSRVSTHLQERDGVSLDAQLDMARRFCEHRGFDLIETFVDTMSGTSQDRPGLARLEAAVKARAFDHVLVYKVDRLSRDAAQYHRLLQDFERHNVGLASLTQDIDATTSMGRLILRILIALAEHESEQTGDRVRDSIKYRAQQGRIIAGHHSPLGLRYTKAFTDETGTRHPGRYEVDEAEADTVRWIYDTYLATRSVVAVVRAAEVAGRTARDGAPLTRSWARGVLANPVYIGELASCKKRLIKVGGKKLTVHVSPDKWIRREAAVPAIVDEATWQAVQHLLALNAARLPAHIASAEKHVWASLLSCGACGKTLTRSSAIAGRDRTHKIYRYICTARAQGGRAACASPAAVSENFLTLFIAPPILAQAVEASIAQRGPRKPRARKDPGADLAGELAKLSKRLRKVRDMYEMSDMPLDEYQSKSAELSRRIAEVQAKVAQAEVPAALPAVPADLLDLWARYEHHPGARNRILDSLVESITVAGTQSVRVEFRPHDHPAWPTAFDHPIIRLSSKEGRRARGVTREGGPPKRALTKPE